MEQFKVGDRVHLKGARVLPIKTFVIVECPVLGATPIPPSTMIIRMAEAEKPERDFYQYGDAFLVLAP